MKFNKKTDEFYNTLLSIHYELQTVICQLQADNRLDARSRAFALIGRLKQEIFYFVSENCLHIEGNIKFQPIADSYIKFYRAVISLRSELFDQELIFNNQAELLYVYANALEKLLKTARPIEERQMV